jgi:HEAT repeat protein
MVGPSVMNALVDSDDSVRAAAVYAAGRLSLDAMPLLLAQLNSTNPAIQVASLRALAGLRPGGRQVSTNVMMIANASTGELRRQAIETLGMLPVATSNAATVVMIALDDSDPAIRLTAIRAVGAMNWKTRAAIPRLIEFARSPAAIEREAAVVALAEFGSRASNGVPAITLLLEDSELRVRAAATNALGRINSPANQLP